MPNQTCLQRRGGVRTRGGNGLTTRVLNKGILGGYTPLCLAEKHKGLGPVKVWLNRNLKWATVTGSDIFDAIQLAARGRIISPTRHYLEGQPPMEVDEARDFLTEVLKTHFSLRRYGELRVRKSL